MKMRAEEQAAIYAMISVKIDKEKKERAKTKGKGRKKG
ncbi:hypothetical protein J2T13_003670 [Paenibacillus sp. DS2015]